MDEFNETDEVENLREPINEGGKMTMVVFRSKVLNPSWFWCVLIIWIVLAQATDCSSVQPKEISGS